MQNDSTETQGGSSLQPDCYAAGPEDTIVSDVVRRYTAQWGLPQPCEPKPEPQSLKDLVTCWQQKASDAVEKFCHQMPFENRDKELWGLYIAYSVAAAQLEAVMKRQNDPDQRPGKQPKS